LLLKYRNANNENKHPLICFGCDNGYRVSQGAVINEYGHLVK